MRIFLTGMMGSGKSAVARSLAEKDGYTLIDLDKKIIEKYGKSIEKIFRESGEATFRDHETETALALKLDDHAVIATGGGFPLRETNRRWMKEQGTVIWLKCEPAVILDRIKDEDRPLLPKPISIDHIEKILTKRLSVYEQADHVIETDKLSPDEISTKIKQIIQ